VATRQDDGIHLLWDPVVGADGYNIYRSIDLAEFRFRGHVTSLSAVDTQNNDQGIDITTAARTYMVKATLGEGQSGACPTATSVEVPLFPSPVAWILAVGGTLGAGLILLRPRR